MDILKMRDINNIREYVSYMEKIKESYSFFLAVCDTPGDKMPESVLSSLHNLGFRSLSKKLWWMYVGIVRCGETLIDRLADEVEVPVRDKGKFGDIEFEIESKSWIKGNKAVIEINGVECAINKRGLNIVIYDEEHNIVIDSIRYDSYLDNEFLEHNISIKSINEKIAFINNDKEFDNLAKK